jgi:hypothetical protein
MSHYQVSKLLRDITRNTDLAKRCRSSIDSVFDDYQLDEQEKIALKDWQLRTLYDMGINPLLLLTSSMALGNDLRSYVAKLNQQ